MGFKFSIGSEHYCDIEKCYNLTRVIVYLDTLGDRSLAVNYVCNDHRDSLTAICKTCRHYLARHMFGLYECVCSTHSIPKSNPCKKFESQIPEASGSKLTILSQTKPKEIKFPCKGCKTDISQSNLRTIKYESGKPSDVICYFCNGRIVV